MKKSLLPALTTAFLVGAASPAFAAANPFSDVPADHWAYEAVAQLAADGVIDGYGDGTYRGEQEITRYEMAQMVAKAMAKGKNSPELDKLAAEFAGELNSLGVRVAALEKKVDNVKWQGELKYEFTADHHRGEEKETGNNLIFRLEPELKVNKNWTVKTRIDYTDDNNFKTSKDVSSVLIDRLWAEGEYGRFTVKLGKIQYDSNFDGGMMWDGRFSGVQAVYNGGNVNVALSGGRFAMDQMFDEDVEKFDETTNYLGVEVFGDQEKKFTWGLGYHQLNYGGANFNFDDLSEPPVEAEDAKIIEAGVGYKFNDKLTLAGAYAKNLGDKNFGLMELDKDDDAYSVELKYRGAEADRPGSYGAWVAYRKLGALAVITPTYDGAQRGYHGLEVGAEAALAKNVIGSVIYFNANANTDGEGDKLHRVYGAVEFFF